jgi:hypothetical protein
MQRRHVVGRRVEDPTPSFDSGKPRHCCTFRGAATVIQFAVAFALPQFSGEFVGEKLYRAMRQALSSPFLKMKSSWFASAVVFPVE